MKTSILSDAITTLRTARGYTGSDIDVVRHTLLDAVQHKSGTAVASLFTAEQNALFAENKEQIAAFIETDNGADAVALLAKEFVTFLTKTV